MAGFGPTELLIVLAIILLLFGSTKVPQMMRGLGQGMRELRDAARHKEETEHQRPAEGERRSDRGGAVP